MALGNMTLIGFFVDDCWFFTWQLQDNADVASDSPSMMDVDTNAGAGPYVEEYTPVIHQYLGHFLTGYQGLIYDFVAVNKPRAWDPLVDSSSIEDQYTYLAQRPLDFLALGGRAALGAEDDANLPEALRYQRTLQEVLLDLYIDIQSQRASDTFDMRLATAWFQALSSALQTAVITRQVAAVSSIRYYLVSAVKRWLALAEVVYGKRLIGNLTNYRHFLQPEEERHFFRKEPQKAAVVYQETERRSLDAQAYICVMSLWLARDDLMSTDATPVYQQPLGKDEEIVGHLCHYEVIGPQRWAKIYTLFASLAIPGLAKYIEGIMKPDLTQDLTYRGLMDHLVFTPVPI
ncbi:hypothetical protein H4R34_002102 [Dimargaris verticillata]|uniref:Uncharacterized protein n=1 Tax=Dimargaris verticillata TaxID=2761393 RepID=A0A9W8BA37_9FUNG|nr:hypothetical protein H4R34_002102 [Dimargaris verticillata]